MLQTWTVYNQECFFLFAFLWDLFKKFWDWIFLTEWEDLPASWFSLFRVVSLWMYTFIPAVLAFMEAPLQVTSNQWLLNVFFRCGNTKKLQGARSGKYAGCGSNRIWYFIKNSFVLTDVCRGIAIVKDPLGRYLHTASRRCCRTAV